MMLCIAFSAGKSYVGVDNSMARPYCSCSRCGIVLSKTKRLMAKTEKKNAKGLKSYMEFEFLIAENRQGFL